MKSWREWWAAGIGGQTGGNQRIVESVIEKLRLTPDVSLLDVGCGDGSLLEKLPARKKNGVDFSPILVSRAKQRRLGVVQAEATKLPFENDSFDRVLSYSVLIYLSKEEAMRAVGEMKRVCKPGGLVLVGDLADKNNYEAGGRIGYNLVREPLLSLLGVMRSTYFDRKLFEKNGFELSVSANSDLRFDALWKKPGGN
ncbi:MAG: class I SAM-dependent methyltransferase [Candidatus Micrarchaeota archaeon]